MVSATKSEPTLRVESGDAMRFGPVNLLAMVAMSAAPTAMGGVVFESLSTDTNGSISNAYSSGGSYLYATSTGQAFSIEDDLILDRITFWGSTQNFNGGQLANLTGYEVIIWNTDFGSIAAQWTLSAGDVTAIATGDENIYNGLEYAISGAISGTLAAGSYVMNIGGFQADPNGDSFVWSSGSIVGGWWYTQNPTWGTWKEAPLMIGSEPGGAFRLEGSVVPSPGAIALLGLAGLAVGRRRR
jgi:MYXO-CTERM domain-containing protein